MAMLGMEGEARSHECTYVSNGGCGGGTSANRPTNGLLLKLTSGPGAKKSETMGLNGLIDCKNELPAAAVLTGAVPCFKAAAAAPDLEMSDMIGVYVQYAVWLPSWSPPPPSHRYRVTESL